MCDRALELRVEEKIMVLSLAARLAASPEVPSQSGAREYIPQLMTSQLLVFVGSKNTRRGGSGFSHARSGESITPSEP